MKVPGARFINFMDCQQEVRIHNRSRVTVFIGMKEEGLKDSGYPVLPGQTVRIKKPIGQLYVVK